MIQKKIGDEHVGKVDINPVAKVPNKMLMDRRVELFFWLAGGGALNLKI